MRNEPNKLVQDLRTNSGKYIDIFYGLVVRDLTTILLLPNKQRMKLVRDLRTIYRRPTVYKILLRMVEMRASTAYVLRQELSIPKQSVYDSLAFLIELGFLVKARPLKSSSIKGGRTLTVFALREATPDDIARAVERDRYARTPAFEEVKRITQLLLDDYFEVITRNRTWENYVYQKEITPILKRECRGVRWFDILPMIEEELNKEGLVLVEGV